MNYRIESAEFAVALPDPEAGKLPLLPEAAFVGRSNSGKSSLLNKLCGRKSIARTGKRPGLTQAFNFYQVQFRCGEEAPHGAYLVDLPGYGFAQVTAEQRQFWDRAAPHYLRTRRELRLVLILSDVRRAIGPDEFQILDLCEGREVVLCLTKVDKLNRKELEQALKRAEESAAGRFSAVYPTSSLSSKFDCLENLRDHICSCLR